MSAAGPSDQNQFICRRREELLSESHRSPEVRPLSPGFPQSAQSLQEPGLTEVNTASCRIHDGQLRYYNDYNEAWTTAAETETRKCKACLSVFHLIRWVF